LSSTKTPTQFGHAFTGGPWFAGNGPGFLQGRKHEVGNRIGQSADAPRDTKTDRFAQAGIGSGQYDKASFPAEFH
jgi:hypothetical protein